MGIVHYLLLLLAVWCENSYLNGSAAQETPAYTAMTYPAWQSKECTHGQEELDVHWICDPDGMFKMHELKQLSTLMDEINSETDCPCPDSVCDHDSSGYVILVAAMKRIHEGTQPQEKGINTARNFAMDLLTHHWTVAEIRCSEEILVVYAGRDSSPLLYTATGSTAMNKLPNNLLTRFSIESLGHLVSNNTEGKFLGIKQLLENYRETLMGRYIPPQPNPPQPVVGGGQRGLHPSLALCLLSLSAYGHTSPRWS